MRRSNRVAHNKDREYVSHVIDNEKVGTGEGEWVDEYR